MGWTDEPISSFSPTSLAATWARTTPATLSRSVTARATYPSSAARSTSSCGWEAPSRNEKFVRQWSSAYGTGAVSRRVTGARVVACLGGGCSGIAHLQRTTETQSQESGIRGQGSGVRKEPVFELTPVPDSCPLTPDSWLFLVVCHANTPWRNQESSARSRKSHRRSPVAISTA